MTLEGIAHFDGEVSRECGCTSQEESFSTKRLQGDASKAKAAFQDFLTLWKDADPDLPILKEGKAEYAKLQ